MINNNNLIATLKSPDWINCKSAPFTYQTSILPKRIYFLYAFLGDGYEINKDEYINNLIKWRQSHAGNDVENDENNSWVFR